MKKIRLVGKKLYRVGPLKCYKDNHHGHGSGGTYSSSRPRGYGSGSGGGRAFDTINTRRDFNEARRVAEMRKEEAARKAAIKKEKEEMVKKAMTDDPTKFRQFLDSADPDVAEAAEKAAMAEENKKEKAAAEKVKADKKVKNALKKGAMQLLTGAVVNVVGLGTVTAAQALASELVSPEKKAAILNKLTPQFMKGEPVTASPAEIQAELDSGNYDNPGNPNVFSGSPATQKRKQESKGDDFQLPEIPGQVVTKTVVEEKAEEGPKGPGKMTEEQLTEMLEKRARGEDSIVEREAKIARERGLAQQLASVRGARGVTAGQRLRALQRGSETTEREIQPQIAVAKAQEQKAAQDALRGLKRGDRQRAEDFAEKEKDRKNLLEQQRIKAGVSGGGGGGGAPGKMGKASSFLNKLSSGVNLFKKAKGFLGFEEGGFVSGKGTETSDSIPARLSDGEFVIKASAVRGIGKSMGAKDKKEERKKGVDFLYKLQDKMDKVEKFAEGGEAYSRPKKAFREAIGHEAESRFHDKAFKDTKHGGARRKFRHFQDGGPVDMKGPGMVKEQFKMPSAGGYGSVVAAQGDLQRRIEELERKVGK